MSEYYVKLAKDLNITKEANLRARLLKLLGKAKASTKPAVAKATAAASEAKAAAKPKMAKLLEYLKKNKKSLAIGGGTGAAAGLAAGSARD